MKFDGDGLAVVGPYLDVHATVFAHDGNTVEAGLQADTVDLVQALIDLCLYRGEIGGAQGAVAGLHGEFANALQVGVDLTERAFGGLYQ